MRKTQLKFYLGLLNINNCAYDTDVILLNMNGTPDEANKNK